MNASRRGWLVLVALAALALTLTLLGTGQSALAAVPTAAFDWSMPARTGLDADHDGVIDPVTDINPGTFTVNFDACASTGSIQHYRWTIGGEFAGESSTCDGFSDQLAEGEYTVELKTVADDGSTATVTRQVTVQDFLIVAVGDSYGSGEGNPEKRADLSDLTDIKPAVWQNKRCHRSGISGQAQAAKNLEDADPHTSVTLVHLSCSGAEIQKGLLDPYGGIEPRDNSNPLPPQLQHAKDLIGDREIDALVMSIGGNDAHFGDIVTGCMVTEPCMGPDTEYVGTDALATLCLALFPFALDDDCTFFVDSLGTPSENAADLFDSGRGDLAVRSGALHVAIDDLFPVLATHKSRVYWTEYPNATEDDDGSVCQFDAFDPLATLPGVSQDEGTWVRDTMTPSMNTVIHAAADFVGWTYVGGIFDAFHKHGYCADDHWFNRLQESFVNQLNEKGAVHPNASGQAVYRDEIYDSLVNDLFTGGDISRPRPPIVVDTVPPVVHGTPDRSPNAAGWYSSDVTIGWTSTDPQPSSGQPSQPPATVASKDGANFFYSSDPGCDPAGNCASGSLTLSIDETPPKVTRDTSADSCSFAGNDGWCRGTQAAGFSASDATSGVDSPCAADPGAICGITRSSSTEGTAVAISSGAVCDVAGSCNQGIDAGPFKIDSTAPTLAPAVGPTPILLHGSATATPNATDATSGVASQSCGALDTGTAGLHTVTCTATDNAGNSATASVTYLVAYRLLGFFSPASNSKWKAGTTVPIKVALADANGTRITDAEAQGLLSPTCRVTFSGVGAQALSACVKYDAKNDQFVFDWKLGKQPGNETITVAVGYSDTTTTTLLSEPIVITG